MSTTTSTPPIAPDPFAAALLESGARGYAGFASSQLMPKLEDGAEPFDDWRVHLTQRLLELAAAVRTGTPKIFVERVRWTRQAALARKLPDAHLQLALETLGDTLAEELPDAAYRSVARILDDARTLFETEPEDDPSELDPSKPYDLMSLRYLELTLEGKTRRGVQLLTEALDDGTSVEDIYTRILLPAQREIGRLWHRGELGISEEHLITATTRRAMSVLCHRAEAAPAHGKILVSAAVEGNLHDIGLRAVSDLFELDGWRAINLGGDVPPGEVATAAVYFDADLVVLSATLVVHLRALEATIEAVRSHRGEQTKVQVGGLTLNGAPELWKQLGADGFAVGAAEAVEVGRRLVGLTEDDQNADS